MDRLSAYLYGCNTVYIIRIYNRRILYTYTETPKIARDKTEKQKAHAWH